MLVFWPYSVFGQNYLYVRMLQTGIPLFRVKLEEIQSSLSAVRTMCHPVRMPTVPTPSVRTTCHTVRTQTVQHHLSGRRAPSIRTPTQYRETSVSACFRPDVSAARLDATQFSNGSLILSKFQEREDQSTVRTMWYTVRTRISIRQELQFKVDR
jgi:hypothetical protein